MAAVKCSSKVGAMSAKHKTHAIIEIAFLPCGTLQRIIQNAVTVLSTRILGITPPLKETYLHEDLTICCHSFFGAWGKECVIEDVCS
jgi:hypothetical protein